ncbi:MAG: hypothetical protein L0Z62_48140 [Gemmataceae bacterium]|nr:hypothetical protein [Gemmataceae bacterium]
MSVIEVRDLDQARKFVVQGLRLQHVLAPTPPTVGRVLEWALEVASGGQPLPPVGLVADLGHTAFALDQGARREGRGHKAPGLPPALSRSYEDHVLGRAYADHSFERAGDALRRYQGRDRARGLAFVVNQFRDRAGFGGVHLSPAVIKGLLREPAERLLAEADDSLAREGALPELVDLYDGLTAAARRVQEMLAPEDIFELEHGTALDDLGQRVALRQVVRAADRLEGSLPRHRIRPRAGRQEVPTRVLDEDTYPVGGFSSLSTRGSVESLLHSQLAYMEKDDRPDLFDVKFLRDELLYYARDENQFLRRRRTFVYALHPDLMQARYKDAELPWQRVVVVLGLLVAAVRKLTEWLSTDALRFDFFLLGGGETPPLQHEYELLETLLREQIANGTVGLLRAAGAADVARHCALKARRSLCHCLTISTTGEPFRADSTVVVRLRVDGPLPALAEGEGPLASDKWDDALDSWGKALGYLLQGWV